MWLYFLVSVIVVLLILLHHYVPRKRHFWAFVAVLAALGAVSWAVYPRPEPPAPLSEQERYEKQQQQEIFAAWFKDYQRDVEQLDNHWQRYHHILENFKEDNISIQTTYVRLQQLEKDNQRLHDHVAKLEPPKDLNDGCYDSTATMLEKTRAYSDAQYRTIALTKAAADPANLRSDNQEEQSRTLQSIMNREAPAGLFIAEEIGAIRDNLAIPDTPAEGEN